MCSCNELSPSLICFPKSFRRIPWCLMARSLSDNQNCYIYEKMNISILGGKPSEFFREHTEHLRTPTIRIIQPLNIFPWCSLCIIFTYRNYLVCTVKQLNRSIHIRDKILCAINSNHFY